MLLTEVEQVLNECALTANSDDPHDLQAITPSHFVMHRNTIAYPPPPPPPLRFFWKDRSVPSKRKGAELYLIVNRMLQYFWLTKMHHEVSGTLVTFGRNVWEQTLFL